MDKIAFIKELERKRERFELLLKKEEMLSFEKIFSNRNEVRLEIGSGRGEFLITMAKNLPNINFIGIDVKQKRIQTMLRNLDIDIHKNVRVCRLFVDENVTKNIPRHSIQKIYLIHPDPWPKRRHFHKRIIQSEFIDAVNQLLVMNGELLISTDFKEYADWIFEMFSQRNDFISVYPEGFRYSAPLEHVETHFEKKKRDEGFPPIFMNFKKVKNND